MFHLGSCKLKFVVFLPELSSVCVLCLSVRSWVEFETSRSRSRVEVRLGSRISQTEVDTPTNQTLLLLLPLLPRVSCCCFSTFFFLSFFFWLHFAHKNTNMATERRLHLFLSMCCCFWLFCYFLFSCGTKEFFFRVLKLAQNNVFCIFFSTRKLTVFRILMMSVWQPLKGFFIPIFLFLVWLKWNLCTKNQ